MVAVDEVLHHCAGNRGAVAVGVVHACCRGADGVQTMIAGEIRIRRGGCADGGAGAVAGLVVGIALQHRIGYAVFAFGDAVERVVAE